MGNKSNSNDLLTGALLGGLVVGASALFLASRSPKLRRDFHDKVQDIKEAVGDFMAAIDEKSRSIAEDVGDQASDFSDKVKDFAQSKYEDLTNCEFDSTNLKTNLLVGGILAGLLGAGAIAYMRSGQSKSHSFDFGDILDKAVDWKKSLTDILDTVEGRAKETYASAKSTYRKNNHINDFLNLAMTGAQLWCNLKKRR